MIDPSKYTRPDGSQSTADYLAYQRDCEREENKNLREINAALLAACKAIAHAIDNKPGNDLGQLAMADALIAMRAAIAKAEGRHE